MTALVWYNVGMEILQAPNLAQLDFVHHGFTTRQGELAHIERVAEAMGVEPSQLVLTAQTHSTNVRAVGADDAGACVAREGFAAVDGLVTNVPGLILAAYCADCALIFAADPVQRAVGLAHAGRAGTEAGMASVLVERLSVEYSSQPSDLVVAIGPCICREHYEIDLRAENLAQLRAAGVPVENIFVSEHCTYEESCEQAGDASRFFSYRASGGKETRRMVGMIGIR